MKIEKIKPIPKYIQKKIKLYDDQLKSAPLGRTRFYAYFTKNDGELVKVTVAVREYKKQWYPHTMGHWLTKLETKHGFKHVSCHGLRHTYCSLLLSQNVPIQTVSKYMGHSDSTVTLEVYSHFIPDTQEKAVFALNNLTK